MLPKCFICFTPPPNKKQTNQRLPTPPSDVVAKRDWSVWGLFEPNKPGTRVRKYKWDHKGNLRYIYLKQIKRLSSYCTTGSLLDLGYDIPRGNGLKGQIKGRAIYPRLYGEWYNASNLPWPTEKLSESAPNLAILCKNTHRSLIPIHDHNLHLAPSKLPMYFICDFGANIFLPIRLSSYWEIAVPGRS